jgi:hypothetical protein
MSKSELPMVVHPLVLALLPRGKIGSPIAHRLFAT